jgi:tetratricopeptide (TPR) repeat protein
LTQILGTDSLLFAAGKPDRDIAHESFLRALNMNNLEKKEVAILFYKRTLANEPGNRFLAFELVTLLTEAGQSKDALALAQIAIQFHGEPNSQEMYLMARLYRENGNIDSCKSYYEKTITANPAHFRALYEYSVVLELLQDYKNLARIYDLLLPQLNYPKPMVEKQLLLLKVKGSDSAMVNFLEEAYQAKGDLEIGQELIEVYLEHKRYDDALQVTKELVAQDSSNVDLLKFSVRTALRSGNINEGILLQARLVALDTNAADELEKLGMLEFEASQWEASYKHFLRLVAMRSNDHLAWFYLSNLEIQQGQANAAMADIQKAIALKPDALAYRNHLSALYAQSGDYEKAHQAIDAALVLHKDHPLALQFKGNTYIHQASRIEATSRDSLKIRELRLAAIPWFQKAIRIDTLATDILFDLAADLERLDSNTAAAKLFDRVLKLDPINHQTMNYYGYMLLDRNLNIERGIRLIDSALVLSPNNDAYLDSKAWYLVRKGDYNPAVILLQGILTRLNLSDPTIWEHLAFAYEGLKDTAKALEAWKNVLAKNPKHAIALRRVRELSGAPAVLP